MSEDLKRKFKNLLSRKFITAMIPIIMGIVAYFISDEAIVKVVGISISAVVGIVFNLIEGKLDQASISSSLDSILNVLKALGIYKPDEIPKIDSKGA